MPKITLEQFWNSDKIIAIHCNTEEKANILLKRFNEMGKKWSMNSRYLDHNGWDRYKDKTCYSNTNEYSPIDYYITHNYTVYDFEEVFLPDVGNPKYKIQITVECDSINTEEIENIKGIKSWTVGRL